MSPRVHSLFKDESMPTITNLGAMKTHLSRAVKSPSSTETLPLKVILVGESSFTVEDPENDGISFTMKTDTDTNITVGDKVVIDLETGKMHKYSPVEGVAPQPKKRGPQQSDTKGCLDGSAIHNRY